MSKEKYFLFIPHAPLQFEVFSYWADVISELGYVTVCLLLSEDFRDFLPSNHSFDEVEIMTFRDSLSRSFKEDEKALRKFEVDHFDSVFARDWSIDRAFQNVFMPYEEAVCLSAGILDFIQDLFFRKDIICAMSEKLFLPQRIVHHKLTKRALFHVVPVGERFFKRFYFEYGLDHWMRQSMLDRYKKIRNNGAVFSEEILDIKDRIIYKKYKPILDDVHNRKQESPSRATKLVRALKARKKKRAYDTIYSKYVFGSYRDSVVTKVIRKKRIKKWQAAYHNLTTDQLPRGKYLVYLFHMQPEITVDGLASQYYNQIDLMARIARKLPSGYELVVKENPLNYKSAKREILEYRELLRHPNIRFLHHTIDAHDLIKSSQAVITLTGTVGIEALFFGKPVFVLGNIFISEFDGAIKIENEEKLIEGIKQLDDTTISEIDEQHALDILQAMYDTGYQGQMYNGFRPDLHRGDENVIALKKGFMEELKKMKLI